MKKKIKVLQENHKKAKTTVDIESKFVSMAHCL